MRTILPLCGGGGVGDDEEEPHSHHRSWVGWMKRLLWVRSSRCVDVHTDTEPGVWLRSFHSLDNGGQNEDPVQEWGEEEEDGAMFGITLRREPVLQNSDSSDLASFACVQYHTVKTRRLKAATPERLVAHLFDPECQEPDFVHAFLSTYRTFTSGGAFVELLFKR
ncbi:ral guanine nucleotide dissociation stimulator-like 3 [Austrofundulus limnaeus]|uniref:Ral guanine nucleotide dissociation stimulator-like 3 n=1 Tax=Austrofundulus limnaeus TaxID=52670 RepID=A0A2I4AMA8_AUSLI|nr:PREDICTED: ral guanine nucleotide dissociation stimulator-like 3 [Austrofundulus limnaeus]